MLTSVLCLALAAAPASWSDVAAKFPELTLPLELPVEQEPLAPLDASELAALGFQSRKEPVFKKLSENLRVRGEGVSQGLSPVARFSWGELRWLVARYDTRFPMGSISARYLFSYRDDGTLLSGFRFDSYADGEIGRNTASATISADGLVTQAIEHVNPLYAVPTDSWLTARARSVTQLHADGSFETSAIVFETEDGEYDSAASKDQLSVSGGKVWLKTAAQKEFELLERSGRSVRSPATGKACVLAWDKRRSSVTCTDPKGTKQVFTRRWLTF